MCNCAIERKHIEKWKWIWRSVIATTSYSKRKEKKSKRSTFFRSIYCSISFHTMVIVCWVLRLIAYTNTFIYIYTIHIWNTIEFNWNEMYCIWIGLNRWDGIVVLIPHCRYLKWVRFEFKWTWSKYNKDGKNESWWIESHKHTMDQHPTTRTSAIRNRNTFVHFVVLIWNIFPFIHKYTIFNWNWSKKTG